jgi:tRNA G10  N-methylase Trm11
MYLFQYGENALLSKAEVLSLIDRPERFQDKGSYAVVKDEVETSLRFGSILRLAKFLCTEESLEKSLERFLPFEHVVKWALSNLDCIGIAAVEEKIKAGFFRMNIRGKRVKPLPGHSRETELSITRAISNKIVTKGVEFLVTCTGDTKTIWTTETYVPLKDFKKADMKRPYKRSVVALPTHLARTMINLARPGRGGRLLDPFCGTGTVLMEAFNDHLAVYGVDKDEVNVKGCITNLKWCGFSSSSYHVVRGDSLELGSLFRGLRFDCVVTEPPMGPLIGKLPSRAQALRTKDELAPFYERALKSIGGVLKEGAPLVLTLPSWKTRDGQRISVDIGSLAARTGLVVDDSLVRFGVKYPIHWAKSENKIERLITVFRKG